MNTKMMKDGFEILNNACSSNFKDQSCGDVCVCQKENVKMDQTQCSSQRFCFPPFCGEESL